MGELNVSLNGRKGRAAAPRIDLTPMVDLGFLLITFFMLTTTLARLRVMELNMPDPAPVDPPTAFAAESTITVIPAGNHYVVYYEGELPGKNALKRIPIAGLRRLIIDGRQRAAALPATFSANAHQLHIIIKPAANSTYGDLVRLMDEMTINTIDFYALTDISADEIKMVSENNW